MAAVKSPRNRTKGFKPSGTLGDALQLRARRAHNIWYLTAPKAGGDIVLRSDAELRHMLALEADPSVRSYTLDRPCIAPSNGPRSKQPPFAFEVLLTSGEVVLQDVLRAC